MHLMFKILIASDRWTYATDGHAKGYFFFRIYATIAMPGDF